MGSLLFGKKNIVLTGFMGTGKTEVGAVLSKLMGWKLVDIDEEIEKEEGMRIKDIFRERGEPAFRDVETEMIKRFSKSSNLIISTGGGAVLREENMAALKRRGVVICLTAGPETILRRTSSSSERPLLQVEDPLGRIKELLGARMPHYEKADFMVATDDRAPYEIAGEILDKVRWKK